MPISSKPKPLFYQKREAFIQELPTKPVVMTQVNSPLLASYVDHYKIRFNKDLPAKNYAIWRSEISSWKILEQRWQPQHTNGKTLLICHGYTDHTGLYGKLIHWALQQGYTVHGFDLPGHGLSDGEPAAIHSFNQYTDVLAQIIHRENYQDYVLVGQSTGCAIILNFLTNTDYLAYQTAVPSRAVLLAPLVRIFFWPLLRWVLFVLRNFLSSTKRSFTASSHDQAFNFFQEHQDPLQTPKIPVSWLSAMDEWVETVKQLTPKETIPCTVIQGTGDKTVDFGYNLKIIRKKILNSTTHTVPGARHHLVKETDYYWHQVTKLLEKYL